MSVLEDWLGRLSPAQKKLLTTAEGRRAVTKLDFESFCFVYFRGVMSGPDTDNQVTLSEFHRAFIEDAPKYMFSRGPAESRTAWVCPRGAGKSSMEMMLIIWLGAFYANAFIALFSATATQAEDMLSNIRSQFNSNAMLRTDFPDLVRPATRKSEAIKLSDNKQLIMQANGFVLTGRGVTTSVLGMRIDGRRPSHIFLDDVEAGEAQTTKTDVAKLLGTLQDDIFPLSLNAHTVWVGTTTRPGGLTETLVHRALGQDHAEWAEIENFQVNYVPALLTGDDGVKRSMWPERWTTEYLLSQEHTRAFRKNYMCLPHPDDYQYWRPEDFEYGECEGGYTGTILSVDPAVTTKAKSDYTGIAVISLGTDKKIYVRRVDQVKLAGPELRQHLVKILVEFPEVKTMLVESNQGGEVWKDVFAGVPAEVKLLHNSRKKELRAADLLNYYQRNMIRHVRPFPEFETQAITFPAAVNDDMIDAVGNGVTVIVNTLRKKKGGMGASNGSYS